MSKIKGKQIILLGLVALVITAGYYRWTVEKEDLENISVSSNALPSNATAENSDSDDNSETTELKDFSQLRQERDASRGEAVAQWQEIQKNSEMSVEAKKEAEQKINNANEYAEKENTVEALVKAKGYGDCFAHVDENGVSIIVSGGEVNGAKVAQIKDIVIDATGTDIKKIKISAQ